jgi:hypothetical protein
MLRIGFTLAMIAIAQTASDRPLPFDKAWELEGEGTAIAKEDGRDVLQMTTGFAHRRDVKFQDGTIDFEVQVTRRRSFVYVNFRAQSEGEHEEFYLRPHKSELPDALQYAPAWQGRSAWQLYHGPGGTAAIAFQPGVWTRGRIVLQGEHAALFLGDLSKPALLVPKLGREPRAGFISLGSFVPAGTPGSGPSAKFANLVLRPDVVDFNFPAAIAAQKAAAPVATPKPLVISSWDVSKPFVPKPDAGAALPGPNVTGEFKRLPAEESGLLQFYRHVPVAADTRTAAAVARVRLKAASAGTCALDLGFSDIATVFVNGRPHVQLDASYSFDRPRREGLIGFDQARLFLPLQSGENELSILLTDSFGGWGLMARIVGCDGVTLDR